MIANCKNGVSSHELARAIGVTQKTAWFMLQRIRLAMQDEDGGKIGGDVEVDETYIGGKARNMHAEQAAPRRHQARRADGRQGRRDGPAGAARQRRPSRVRTSSCTDREAAATFSRTSTRNVERGATVYTDALQSYEG